MDNNVKKHRKAYPTVTQKARLVDLLEADAELRAGKFSASFTSKIAAARWEKLAADLNSVPGAKKSPAEWKKTWHDMKSKCKKKTASVNRAANMTGGGSPPDQLTQEDTTVLKLLNKTSLVGHEDCQESKVFFFGSTGSQSNGAVSPQIMKEIIEIGEDIQIEDTSSTPIVVAVPQIKDVIEIDDEGMLPPPEEFSESTANEAPKTHTNKNKRNVASKRMQQSLDAATSLNKHIEEKNKYKKIFYQEFIKEMRRQSDAMCRIADSLTTWANTSNCQQ